MRYLRTIGLTLLAVLVVPGGTILGDDAASASEPQSRLDCDPSLLVPYPLDVPEWDPQSTYETVYDWAAGGRPGADLGIGHVAGSGSFWWSERHVRLPLHAEPGGAPWGWFADGWLIDAAPQRPDPMRTGALGMVETDYEIASLIVLEARPDGWLRVRHGKPTGDRDGTAWAHRCHLARESLVFERWEDRFLSGEISPLFFREDAPQALLARPDDGSPRVLWIANDYHMEPLGFKGDWMQVRVKQPSDYCVEPDDVQVKTYDGWIRWRSPERGPIVWYHTRGC